MIYVHIPFCKSFCTYCGFYSEKSVCYEAFAKALRREIRLRRDEIAAADEIKTLYFGGGTPSVLPLPLFKSILEALGEMQNSSSRQGEEGLRNLFLRNAVQSLEIEEFTVEMNPEDVLTLGPEYAEELLRLGVTRASLGVQSFDDGILRWMNRRHSAETAVKAYRLLESAGFDNISIDLIFGLPRIDGGAALAPGDKWSETIDRALNISATGMPPRHISAYQLSVEEDSALEKMIQRGQCSEEDGEECAAQYDLLCSRLAAAGYNHYEISNFALPGFEARHNSAYWTHAPYVGLGPGAHSLRRLPGGGFQRSWNAPDLQGYIAALGGEASPEQSQGNYEGRLQIGEDRPSEVPGGGEILTGEQIGIENVMLGLRTAGGCSLTDLRNACSAQKLNAEIASGHLVPASDVRGNPSPLVAHCSASDLSVNPSNFEVHSSTPDAGEYYRIPENYFFISDNIIKELLS